MRDDLVERLKALSENASLSFDDESALVNYIQEDFNDGEELLLILAEHSPTQARVILAIIEPLLGRYQFRDCEQIIERYEEAKEAREMDHLSQTELDARLALLALLPPESPKAQSMNRVLTRVLVRRDPVRAVELLQPLRRDDDDYEFRRSLQRELFWFFHQTNPNLALRCLQDAPDAQNWLGTLLKQKDTAQDLCLEVLERLITMNSTFMLTENWIQQLTSQIAKSAVPYRKELFVLLGQYADRFGFPVIERVVRAGHSLSRTERRSLADSLRREAVPLLSPNDRKKALRHLLRARLGR